MLRSFCVLRLRRRCAPTWFVGFVGLRTGVRRPEQLPSNVSNPLQQWIKHVRIDEKAHLARPLLLKGRHGADVIQQTGA